MEQQLIRCLKAFATELLSNNEESAGQAIDNFMERAELALSPSARQELIDHIQNLVNQ